MRYYGSGVNIVSVDPSSMRVSANILCQDAVIADYFVGNGAMLTGVTATLPTTVTADILGNLTGTYATLTGNATAAHFLGNGSLLTGVTATIPSTVTADILGNLTGTKATLSGNATAAYFLGNGALLTGVTATLPATVTADLLGNVTGTKATLAGNVSASYFVGNGALLAGVLVANAGLPRTIAADIVGNVTGTTLSGALVGNLTGNNVTLIGNVSSSYFLGNGALLTGVLVANAGLPRTIAVDLVGNVTGTTISGATLSGALVGNLTGNNVTLIGNASASYFVGNGALLTGVLVANAGLPRTITADLVGNVTGTTISGATISGALVGNLTGNNVTLIGNASASYFIGNGALLTGVLVANAGLPRTITADLVGNVTGTTISGATISGALVGNLTGNNVTLIGNASASYFIGNGSLLTGVLVANAGLPRTITADLVGNVTGTTISGTTISGTTISGALLGNLTGNNVTLIGNVSSSYFIGNGALLTGILVANAGLPRTIAADLFGNVTGTTISGATISGALVGNLTGNNVTLIGNASASYFIGNGSLLTGVLVANAGLPRTIAADIVGNQAGATMTLTGNAAASGGMSVSTLNVSSGTTVANTNGVFTSLLTSSNISTTSALVTGRLTVQGVTAEFTANNYFISNPPGANPVGNIRFIQQVMTTQPISITTLWGIFLQGGNIWIASDSRKKFEVVAESPATCAAAVRASRLVSYSTGDATGRQLGFIAQQVANVVPGSVTLTENAVPTVMRLANVATERSFVLEGASESLTVEHAVGVRLIKRSGEQVDAKILSIAGDVVTIDESSLTGDDVFVYGPVVDDFRTLDYQRMWGTAFGAVKHLIEKGDERDEELASLRGRMSAAESAIYALRARLDATST